MSDGVNIVCCHFIFQKQNEKKKRKVKDVTAGKGIFLPVFCYNKRLNVKQSLVLTFAFYIVSCLLFQY